MERVREHAADETAAPAPAVAPGPAPAPLTPAGITQLQRTIGNAAVGRLVLQREPTAEQKADALEDQAERARGR